jgi:hypothetical protein
MWLFPLAMSYGMILENFAPILIHTKGMDSVGVLRLLQSPVPLLSEDCLLLTMGIGMGIKCSK